MSSRGYKKYMKQEKQKGNPFLQIFLISFFGMLFLFTLLIKSFSPSVDTSIGDYQEPSVEFDREEIKKIDNNRLEMIQSEDQGRTFSELMSKPEDVVTDSSNSNMPLERVENSQPNNDSLKEDKSTEQVKPVQHEVVYKVFIGSYTSAEQAKVAKDIIQESGNGLNPIVKCIGSNNYTLQVGIFKNKQSAEAMLYTVQQNHLPGRIVQDY